MSDSEFIRTMDIRLTNPPAPRQGRYQYRMTVSVVQEWDMEIDADTEDEAYRKADDIVKYEAWRKHAELWSNKEEVTACDEA